MPVNETFRVWMDCAVLVNRLESMGSLSVRPGKIDGEHMIIPIHYAGQDGTVVEVNASWLMDGPFINYLQSLRVAFERIDRDLAALAAKENDGG